MGKNVSVKFLGVTVYEKREVVEQRNSPVTPIDTPEQWFMNMLGDTSNSGIVVTDDLAMTLSTVWSCVRVLGETLAMLPLNVYTRDASGNRNIAYGDYL